MVSNTSIIKTLGIGLTFFPILRLVLVLVLIEIPNKDKSWYWSRNKFEFETSLGLEQNQWSRRTLSLIRNYACIN